VLHRRLDAHLTKEDDMLIEGKFASEEDAYLCLTLIAADWNFPASHKDLADILQGFHPSVQALMM
jgi:hypothetical protein